jgi:hypothetical protein
MVNEGGWKKYHCVNCVHNVLSDRHMGGRKPHGAQVAVPAVAVVGQDAAPHPLTALQQGHLGKVSWSSAWYILQLPRLK